MKKFFAFFLAVAMLVSVVALASCNRRQNYVVDTYNGSVSKESYETKEDTVSAYLANELSGQTTTAVLVDYSVEKELTQSEIDELDISVGDKVGLEKVEQVKVKYIEKNTVSAVALASSDAKTHYRVVLVFIYSNGMFKYYATVVEVGETLTNSYLDSVFATENYVNCTMNSSVTLTMTAKTNGMTVSMNMEMSENAKITQNAIWVKDEIDMSGFEAVGGASVPSKMEIYAWNDNDELNAAYKTDSDWVYGSGSQYSNIGEAIEYVINNMFGAYDATYFVKTADGYELQTEKAKNWFVGYSNKIADAGANLQQLLDMCNNFDVSYKVSVRDGKVSQLNLSVSFSVTQDGQTVSINVTGTNNISNFGSTTVTVPQEVLDLAK